MATVARVTASTILEEVRTRARPTSTRSRIRTSARIESASLVRSGPRSRPSIREALASETTTRSAAGCRRSRPSMANASTTLSPSSRLAKIRTSLAIGLGAISAVESNACSSPAAPAMLSLIISVQVATACVRSISCLIALVLPKNHGKPITRIPVPTAAPIQRVAANTTSATTQAPAVQAVAVAAVVPSGNSEPSRGRMRWPRSPWAMSRTPRATPAHSAAINTVLIGTTSPVCRASADRSRPAPGGPSAAR